MLSAGVDKVYRDTILGHSLKGMDVHYMSPSEDDLHRAMAVYTEWLDVKLANVAQNVAQVNEKGLTKMANPLKLLARPEGFEPPTLGFVVRCSIRTELRALGW